MPDQKNVDHLASLLEQAKQASLDYLAETPEAPVVPDSTALSVLSALNHSMPFDRCEAADVLAELATLGRQTTTRTTGGRYFGFVTGGTLPVGLATHWLADTWDQNAALHVMSPLATTLESVCEKWLLDLLGLPEGTVASFVTGSSIGNLCAIAAARHHILAKSNWNVERQGLRNAPEIKIVASEVAHSSIAKAIAILGLGTDNIIKAPVDHQGRIDPAQLPVLDANTILLLQAGDVNSGSFDPFVELCTRAKAVDAWVHIDGAFGLWAAANESTAHLCQGIELADSWVTDAHKTLNAPYDGGIVFCRDADHLRAAMAATGSYIQYSEQRDPMTLAPEMSRRGRAIELWAILKTLGKSGVAELVQQLCDRTQLFANLLHNNGFIIVNDVVFNQILVKLEDNDHTQTLLHKLQSSGEIWCGGAIWQGQQVIRISICSWVTSEADIHLSAETFLQLRGSLD